MTPIYRISEGVLLRSRDGLIDAFVGSEWKYYPGVVEDWFTKSNPANEADAQRMMSQGKQTDSHLHETAGRTSEVSEKRKTLLEKAMDLIWGNGQSYP